MWRSRPLLATLLRAALLLVPLAAAVGAGFVFASLVSEPRGAAVVAWWGALLAIPLLTLGVFERAVRRLLPLCALLQLTVVFPDKVPSRFGVALRATSTRALEQDLERLREGRQGDALDAAHTVIALSTALARHDNATRGHSERVRAFSELIAEELRVEPTDRERLRWVAMLHDIGKMVIPREVLNKPGELDDSEWGAIRRHPAEGARLVAPISNWLGEWYRGIAEHHERWDGSGYPSGLAGGQISLAARIIAVADAFDVMTARRSYRLPVSPNVARRELVASGGQQFDPEVVRALLGVSLGKLRRAMGPFAWLAQIPLVTAFGSDGDGAPAHQVKISGAHHAVARLAHGAALHPGVHPPGGHAVAHGGHHLDPGQLAAGLDDRKN